MNLEQWIYQSETMPMLSHLHVGTGIDCTIKELTEIVAKVVGYSGEIRWDSSKPDGAPRKLLDVSRLKKLGWKANIGLEEGLTHAYSSFLNEFDSARLT
jgi:GDP-L-fucose synthase